MDLFRNQLKISFLFILFFVGCELIIDNEEDTASEFEIITFYADYDNEENEISVYLEASDNHNISSISASVSIPNDEIYITEFDLTNLDINSNIFLYQGSLILSDDVYIYDINIIIEFENQEEYLFSENFTTPIKPEITDYTMASTYQLNETDWTFLPIDIQISDLNGPDNIESVKYEIKRELDGCNGDCVYDDECNNSISDSEYQSDPTWIFHYLESIIDTIDYSYTYHVDIPMRPLNGDALYDDDGNIVFEASDCGRTGVVLFKFIIIDIDGLSNEVIDIPLEITE